MLRILYRYTSNYGGKKYRSGLVIYIRSPGRDMGFFSIARERDHFARERDIIARERDIIAREREKIAFPPEKIAL